MIIYFLQLLPILLISVIVHELGHTVSAIFCGVSVKEFCIGFGKPKISKIIKGIKFSVTPWLLGGYTSLKGEYNKKQKDGFLSQRYSKKVLILSSGVILNILIAFICYWVNYRCIITGLYVDWQLLRAMFSKNYAFVNILFFVYEPNLFLVLLGFFNMVCAVFNLLPIPSLDGSLLGLVWLEKVYPKRYGKIIQRICWTGFAILMLVQIPLAIYIWRI